MDNKYISSSAINYSRVFLKKLLEKNPSLSFSQVEEMYSGVVAPDLELAMAWNELVTDSARKVDVEKLYLIRVQVMDTFNDLVKSDDTVAKTDSKKKSKRGNFLFSFSLLLGCFALNGFSWRAILVYWIVLFVYPFVYAFLMIAWDIFTGHIK